MIPCCSLFNDTIGKWVCYNCQNHPISPVRLADASEFVSQDTVMKPEGASNLMLGDDLRLQCDEDMGECTVEVKDIHIQGRLGCKVNLLLRKDCKFIYFFIYSINLPLKAGDNTVAHYNVSPFQGVSPTQPNPHNEHKNQTTPIPPRW